MGERCDGCGREVSIAGGIANFWTMDNTETGGLELTFDADDSVHFLCFACIEQLPDDPSATDVRDLGES